MSNHHTELIDFSNVSQFALETNSLILLQTALLIFSLLNFLSDSVISESILPV